MKKLLFCLCLILVAAELSFARTKLGGRSGGKTTKRPIVQIRKDGPKDEDASQLVGQVTVDTDGLDEYEHPKLKKGEKDRRILGRYIAITNHSYSFFQVAGLLDTFYGAAQQRGSSFQIRGATTMSDAFQGFTAQMNKEALETVLEDPNIVSVEEDQMVHGAQLFEDGFQYDMDTDVMGQVTTYAVEQEWHTDRINQRSLPLDGTYSSQFTGIGVDVYILDSGIRYTHQVFGGRARFGGYDYYNGRGEDCHGHGTHCAGLAAGRVTGVAWDANVYSIKVLNCNLGGSYAAVIEGINYVVQRRKATRRPTVISMSLIGPKSDAVNEVLRTAKDAGVVSLAAAGNFRRDSCEYHPSSSPHVITVGGTQEDGDQLYWFSRTSNSPGTNYGPCVDIFAPGQWVRSAGHICDDCTVSMSGTSMATPIAAGVAALLMQENPNLNPDQIKQLMIDRSTKGVLDFSVIRGTNTPNRLVYVQPARSAPPEPQPTTPPPTQTTQPPTTTRTTRPPATTQTTRPPTPATTTQATTTASTQPPTTRPTTPPFYYRGPTTPLPSVPSEMTSAVIKSGLRADIEQHRRRGFIPASFTPFLIGADQYFSIVYRYVGISNVVDYQFEFDLTESQVNAYRTTTPDYKIQYIAPYLVDDFFRFAILLNRTSDDLRHYVLVTPLQFESWYTQGLRLQGFSILNRKTIQEPGTGNILISAVFGKRGSDVHSYYDNLGYEDLISAIQSEFNAGYKITDLYSYMFNRDVRYLAVFSPERFGNNQYVIRIGLDRNAMYNAAQSFRSDGYHLTTLLPVPESFYPYYIAAWWK